jgi:hypothetical protein
MFELQTSNQTVACANIDDLIRILQMHRGQSVAVDDLRHGGRLHHLDVSESGGCSERFASRRIVDLRMLLAVPGRPVYP